MLIRQNIQQNGIMQERKLKVFIGLLVCSFIFIAFSGLSIQDLFGSDPSSLTIEGVTNAAITVIRYAANTIIIISTIFFIVSGIRYMTAAGNDDTATKAKNGMTWAVVGIIVIFVSVSAVTYLLHNVLKIKAGTKADSEINHQIIEITK